MDISLVLKKTIPNTQNGEKGVILNIVPPVKSVQYCSITHMNSGNSYHIASLYHPILLIIALPNAEQLNN